MGIGRIGHDKDSGAAGFLCPVRGASDALPANDKKVDDGATGYSHSGPDRNASRFLKDTHGCCPVFYTVVPEAGLI